MASGGPSGQKRKEVDLHHTCGMCMEPLRRRSPKLLPCFHSFCLVCLTALEESVRSAKHKAAAHDDGGQKEEQPQEESNHGDSEATPPPLSEGFSPLNDVTQAGRDDVSPSPEEVAQVRFPCPTCRTLVLIPEGGVAAFQANFYVDHDLGPDEEMSSVLCDMCEEDKQQHATHACQECRRNMCRTCRRCHDIMASDHHVTPVSSGQPAKEKGDKKGGCLVHQDQVLCFYCHPCDAAICLYCKVTSHGSHDSIDLVSEAVKAQDEITSLIPTVQIELQAMEARAQRAERDERELTRQAQEARRQIDARCDTLLAWVRRSSHRLAEQVSAREARARCRLRAHTSCSRLTRDALSAKLSRAAHRVTLAATRDPGDVLECRAELKAALLAAQAQDKAEDEEEGEGEQEGEEEEEDGKEKEKKEKRGNKKPDHHHHQQRQADGQGRGWYDVNGASGVLHEDDVRVYMGRVLEEEEGEEEGVEEGGWQPVSLREVALKVERWMEGVAENTSMLSFRINSCSDDVTHCQNDVASLQKKTDEFQKKDDEIQTKTDDFQKKTDDLEKKTDDLQKKDDDVEKKTDDLQKKSDDLEKKTDDLQKKTDDLQKKTDDLQKKSDDLKKKSDDLKKKDDDLQKKEEELQKKADELEKKTASLQEEITTSRKTEDNLQTAVLLVAQKSVGQTKELFYAHTLDSSKTQQDRAMVFSQVHTNDGRHYDPQTGVFTAPLAGLYYFTAGVGSVTRDTTVCGHVMVDSDRQCVVEGGRWGSGGGPGRVLVSLTAKQTVWVKAVSPVDRYDGSYGFNYFRGRLVLPAP